MRFFWVFLSHGIMMTGTSISSNLSNYELQSYYKLQEFDGELIGILDDIDIGMIVDNTGWYCKTRNWLGLHPISHSRHNTLSIILRATLTSEMTTSPYRTIQEYNTASGEDPSNDRSNAWGSWPVIAGWDRTKWPTYARAVIMPMYTKPKPYYAMSRKYICSAYHRVCFSMQYCSKTSHHDISSDVQSTECHTLVCRINDPAMIIAMIAGPQGTRAEDYAVHMSPQAKLPVRFMSSCPHTNTNNM